MGKLLALLLLLSASQAVGQEMAAPRLEESRVRAMESYWSQAIRVKDVKALKLLLAPELLLVEYDGKLMGRDEYIAGVTAVSNHPERITNESLTVHFYGNIAVTNGVYQEKGTRNERPYVHRERFTDTWVNRSGRWMCVASHSTLLGP